ncbi:MAG: M14 family zinc carboxypeptidase [Pseudomonadota bacterium]
MIVTRWARIAAMLIFAMVPAVSSAQSFLTATYDESIPTLEEFVGHDHGDEITSPEAVLEYIDALAAAAPDRVRVEQYAESWEGRELVYAIIASPEVIARLDDIKANIARLASGTISASEQSALVADTPAVVWLGYGIHGNEISGSDAALALAYHLLAATGDPTVDDIFANTIVIIDPMQNPDGRNRFVNSFEAARGLEVTGDRFAAEHDEPWPGGRFNHYVFDMNRDWFTLSQPETVGRVLALQERHPVAVVDAHEMGGDQTYFFPPVARPINPNVSEGQLAKEDLIGKNHARYFDREGIEYFTREIFDAFYPGYGDMWPKLNGSIAMTYEQSSARGLLWHRKNGTKLTFKDGVKAHFLATLSTAEVVARNKALFLGDYAEYRRNAVDVGNGSDDRFYAINLSTNRWQAERTARQLAAQGISVQRISGATDICGTDFSDGAYVVDLAQPSGRLAQTLLAEDTPLNPDFVAEQEARRERGLDWEIYDVTAWSLPLMHGLDAVSCRRVDLSSAVPVSADDPMPDRVVSGEGLFGYVVPWSDAGQAKLVIAALRAGLVGKTADEAFVAEGRSWPRGSVVFSRSANSSSFGNTLREIARELGAEVAPLSSSWTEAGPNLGSSKFKTLMAPKVAMIWDEGVSPTDAGAVRFVLEQEFDLPVTPIRTRTLGRADLDLYDVLILPDGRYRALSGSEQIVEFVEEGGVVVGFAGAVSALSAKSLSLLSTRAEKAWSDPDADGAGSENEAGELADGTRLEDEDDYEATVANEDRVPDSVPGVLLNAVADQDHWLSAGYEEATALFWGSDIFTPLAADDGTNVFRFAAADDVLASGYLWAENTAQLAYKPFVMAQPKGDGLTIGFAESPVTRAYLDGLNLLLLNAVLLGPAHTD